MQESVTGIGPLTKIRVGGWMPFLNFVFLLNKNRALHLAHTEVQDAWGNISDTALREWRRLYQDGLKTANEKLGLLKIGGARPQQIVVVDESVIGVHHSDGAESMVHGGISKGAPRVRSSSRQIPQSGPRQDRNGVAGEDLMEETGCTSTEEARRNCYKTVA